MVKNTKSFLKYTNLHRLNNLIFETSITTIGAWATGGDGASGALAPLDFGSSLLNVLIIVS